MNLKKVKEVASLFNCFYKENEILAHHTRLGIGGKSLFYIKPSTWNGAQEIIKVLKEEKIPFKVLGKGTNLLISDKDLDFGVLHLSDFEKNIKINETLVEVTADTSMGELSRISFTKGLSGLEELCLIPGTIGGCIVMNAGAFGKTVFDLIENVSLLNGMGNENLFARNDIVVKYRKTNIKDLGIVKSAVFKLAEDDISKIKERTKEYKKKRDLSQPWREKTCGSVFKNTKDAPAGKILEELGFKGKRIGYVRFSEKHSNFLISEPGAKFEDALNLIEEAKDKAQKNGFFLELEMEIWQNAAN